MAPLATAQAAPLANCSIWSASRSRSGLTCSSTRRATTFPHPWATRPIPVESIEGDLRKGIRRPSLDFGNETNWETRVDIIPGGPRRANRVLHPCRAGPGFGVDAVRLRGYFTPPGHPASEVVGTSSLPGGRDPGDHPEGKEAPMR